MRSRWPERYPTWESIARRIGVEPATVRTWVRTLGLPEEVQDRIAPREKQRVPEGKIDYQTALRVAEQIPEPERQAAVVEQIVEERLPQRVAAEVIRRVAAEPHGEVKQMVEQAVRETQPIMSFNHRHYKAVVAGQKTQTTRRRLDPGLKEGVTVRAAVTHFADLEIEHIDRKRLREAPDRRHAWPSHGRPPPAPPAACRAAGTGRLDRRRPMGGRVPRRKRM